MRLSDESGRRGLGREILLKTDLPRDFYGSQRQKTEAMLGCLALNKMTALGMPVSVRVS